MVNGKTKKKAIEQSGVRKGNGQSYLYSSVLSLLQKPVNVRVMSRTVSGNEFQIEGPEVAKLHDRYRASRLRGIVRS